MTKTEESLFALTPLAQAPSFGNYGQMVAMEQTRPSNREEQWVFDEYHKQTLIMEGLEIKTVQAMKLIGEIHKEGTATFDEAVAFILSIKDEQRGKEHQAYVDEFCIRGLQMMGRHLLATMEVGATNIGVEVHRSLYPSVPPEKPPSLLKRIFG
jgi:hypothetical protein